MTNQDNLSQLKMLQAKHTTLMERLKEMKTTDHDFEKTQAMATQVSKDIDAIMVEIDKHNKRIAQLLNEGHEHSFGVMVNAAIQINL